MRRTPDDTGCDWVRDRLPLMAGEDALAPGEVAEDRRAVEAHLVRCKPCRARRDGLSRALEALADAAGESPVEAHAPSLWPALQARIAAQAEGSRIRKSSDRPRPQARPRPSAPTLVAPAPTWFDRIAAACERRLRPLASPVGALAAAALLVLSLGLHLADRAREDFAAQSRAASAPLPPPALAAVAAARPEPPRDSEAPAPADLVMLDDRSLARSDDPPLLDPEGRPLDPRKLTPTPAPATPPAVRFDLDRGIPMPPDARVARPAY